jgi:acetoin utilization deacetylase AcuC-like enzyme
MTHPPLDNVAMNPDSSLTWPQAIIQEIPVFYDERQVANPESFSPSAQKPSLLIRSWLDQALPIILMPITPVSRRQLALAHDRSYVDAVLELRSKNGFGERSQGVADSLPWTTGSLLSAARYVLETRAVAVSPTSGFHHASYRNAFGFCTFNGLMVTARALLEEKRVSKIGILDCDYHFGDGTADIMRKFGLEDSVVHVTSGAGYQCAPETFFLDLERELQLLAHCDIILYQAGADAHVDDPLGGFLTSAQMALRDRLVFESTRRHGVPLVWNLAGGYQAPVSKVIDLHTTTLLECINVYLDSPEKDHAR